MTPGVRAALRSVGVALLGGCALLQPERSADTEPPLRPVVELEIDAPEALSTLLRTHLDIARFQQMPEAEAIGPAEIDRLVGAAPAQARALLETEGYFAASVTARREPGEGLPLVRVTVVPGPPTLVSTVQLDVAGDLQTALAAGATHAVDTVSGLRRGWSLQPGARFRQADWSDAKNSTLAALRAAAYPAAVWQDTQARVEVASHTAGLRAVAASGPRFLLGPIRVEGLEHHDASSVQRLATFNPGAPATERTLLDFQERVQKLGLFETVQVELDNDPERAQAAPVTVRVREQPLQQATVGVGVTSNTGPRVTLEHVHRRPFDVPWITKNIIELGSTRRSWELNLTSHPVPGLYRNLLSGNVEQLATGEEVRTTGDARVGRTQDTVRIERLYFAEFVSERLVNPAGATRSEALSANYQWVFRELDSIILPTDGQSLSAKVAAGYAQSTTQDSGPFGRIESKLSLWRPVGDRWYGTARFELGQVFAADNVGIPDSLLFRAGGDESVRGYAYRSLGPTRDGVLVSGRALATGSIELARPVSAELPSVWGAVFLDAGNAADNFGELRPVAGYGVGVRWRSPVGPLRVDLAYGHQIEKFRLHLSVGIAF